MINVYRPKSASAKKNQALRGRKIKKRSAGKVIYRLKELAVYVWRPGIISALTLLLLFITAYNKIDLNQILPIQSVKIEGEFDFLNKEELRIQTMPIVTGGFFNVNLPSVRGALVNLPWVEDVSVRRQWPDILLVRVIEKKPVVLWGDSGVISAKGELFEPAKIPVLNLPYLSGPQGQHRVMLKELARMQAWLLETGLQIQGIELNARRSWILTMTSGMKLRLGRKLMHERLDRFVSVYSKTLATKKREIKHIDMRYTNGFAVAWKEA